MLQADIAYEQLQHVQGLTVVPVNRVAEVYATLRIDRVQSAEQAAIVCDLLGCDATGRADGDGVRPVQPAEDRRVAAGVPQAGGVTAGRSRSTRGRCRGSGAAGDRVAAEGRRTFVQAVGMFDAANGTVRDAVLAYAAGRNDPVGPMGPKSTS